MIIFLLKASFVVVVLLLFYKIFLEKESFFGTNRIYLLGCLILIGVLPFISLPKLFDAQGILTAKIERVQHQSSVISPNASTPANNTSQDSPTKGKQNLTPSESSSETATSYGLAYWLLAIYFFGVMVFTLHLATQVLGILRRVWRSNDKIRDTDCTIVNTSRVSEPCSFFGYIFINPENYDLDTYEQIIAHEKIHVEKLHTIDLLLSEIAVIIFWFNPLVWGFRREIEKNLEYQTDDLLLANTTVEKRDYQMNLLKITTFHRPLTVTTNYNQSLLKQRIKKMNTKKSSPHSYWKYAFIVPTLLVILVIMNKPLSTLAQNTQEESPSVSAQGDNQDCRELLRAVKAGNQTKVTELLKTTNPDCTYYGDGEPRSPLVAAARNGDLKIGQLLIEAQAEIAFHAAEDETPLMAAAKYGHLDFVKYLVAQGAKVNKTLGGDGTALITASQNGHLEVVKYLLAQNADINQAVRGDGTALIVAAKNGYSEVVKYLLTQGATVDQPVPGDGTALINAVKNNHYTTAELLLENGADPYLHVPGDEYAMFHARIEKNKEMIALLNQYAKEE